MFFKHHGGFVRYPVKGMEVWGFGGLVLGGFVHGAYVLGGFVRTPMF